MAIPRTITRNHGVVAKLAVGGQYTRPQLRTFFGVPGSRGGDFDTGHARVRDAWVIFSNLGGSRTGHSYENRWEGDRFIWFSRSNSKPTDRPIAAMVKAGATVHLFTREHDRAPFTYHGLAETRPEDVSGSQPVRVVWRLRPAAEYDCLPDEINGPALIEGAKRVVVVNAYERNRIARQKCVEHWGTVCYCCGLDMGERYGEIAEGYIHVHHLRSIASIGENYTVDPIADLRPVCPNCHAVIHLADPPMPVDELRQRLRGT